MPIHKLKNADSGGQWWQIVEVYPHKNFYLGMARSLYMQFKALYDRFREVEIALNHSKPANKENTLRLIFTPTYLELIYALLSTIYLKTFVVFKIRKVEDSDFSHPVITTNIKRICPHCNSNRYGCLSDRFWESFSMSYQKPNGSFLHIKRCNRTKQLFIVEHPREILLVENLNIKSFDKEVQITGKNGKTVECPICHNKRFSLDESKLIIRCTRDMTPLLIYRKEDVNDIIDSQSYGEELQNQYANLDYLLSNMITTCKIPYDNRPIYGPPFGISDIIPEQAGFDRPLDDREKDFARSLKMQRYELKDVLRIAKKVGHINFYKLQRKRLKNK